MTETVTDPVSIQDIKFSFLYSTFSLLCGGVLVLVSLLSEGVAAFGRVLHSPHLLLLTALFELGKIWLVRRLSGHGSALSLSLPTSGGQADSKPIRGPLLRKLWVKLSRLLARLSPLWELTKGLVILAVCWMFLVYITVCFGAPVMSEWWQTGMFCLLLLLLTVYPCLVVEGPRLESLSKVYSVEADSETLTTLHCNALYSLMGAWLGAIPLPLDWDRDWQVWPISCCLGATLGNLLANLVATLRVWPRLTVINRNNRRKFL